MIKAYMIMKKNEQREYTEEREIERNDEYQKTKERIIEQERPARTFEIEQVDKGSIKFNEKWYKVRNEKLRELYGYQFAEQVESLRKKASPRSLTTRPQYVLRLPEMKTAWQEVTEVVRKKKKYKDLGGKIVNIAEYSVFPIAECEYLIIVIVEYEKNGKTLKKELWYTVTREIPRRRMVAVK